MAWLTGWSYRKNHVITGATGAQTDYQVGIKVYYGAGADGTESVYGNTYGKVYCDSKCEADFGDIRFTQDDGETEIYYWIEESTISTSANIWVEVPSIPASPTTIEICMYYGKASEITTSNMDNTFVDNDDFEDDGFSEWTMIQTVTSSADQAYTGSKSAKQAGGGLTAAYLYKDTLAYTDNSIHLSVFSGNGINDEGSVMQCFDNSSSSQQGGIRDDGNPTNLIYIKDGGSETDSGVAQGSDAWHHIEARVVGGTTAHLLIDGSTMFSDGTVDTELDLIWIGNLWGASDSPSYWDTFYIRKYISPEPTHTSWGGEEEEEEEVSGNIYRVTIG